MEHREVGSQLEKQVILRRGLPTTTSSKTRVAMELRFSWDESGFDECQEWFELNPASQMPLFDSTMVKTRSASNSLAST